MLTIASSNPLLAKSTYSAPAQRPAADSQPEVVVFDLPSSEVNKEPTELYEVPSQPAPTLERPVLLVHGFNGAPGNWKNMHTWLTSNSANKSGSVVGGNHKVDKDAKVFLMEFSRPFNSIKTNAQELRAAIDKIAAATGSAEVDIVSHSMGGLDTRAYLDQGNEKVNKFVMIGTPNRGSALADLELTFRGLGVPIKPPVDDAEIRQALKDLSEDRMDDGKPNNPNLHALNKNWDRQRSRADIMIIAGNGKPTLQSKTLLTFRGDGVVTQKSTKLPNVDHKNIWWTSHSGVKEHPEALLAVGNFLTGKAVDLREEEPPNVPADKEIVPLKISASSDQIHYLIEEQRPRN